MIRTNVEALRRRMYQLPSDENIIKSFASLQKRLLQHQIDAQRFIHERDGRGMLLMEMGVGKTPTALSIMLWYASEWPLLIVCEATARTEWEDAVINFLKVPKSRIYKQERSGFREATLPRVYEESARNRARAKYTLERSSQMIPDIQDSGYAEDGESTLTASIREYGPIVPEALSAKRKKRQPGVDEPWVYIISHAMARERIPQIMQYGFRAVIVDESDVMRDMDSLTTQALLKITLSADRVLLLSGTPLERHIDLFPQAHAIRPDMFPNLHTYVDVFCLPIVTWKSQTEYTVDRRGASNEKLLRDILLKHIGVRYRKIDMDADAVRRMNLGDPIVINRQVVYLELDEQKIKSDNDVSNTPLQTKERKVESKDNPLLKDGGVDSDALGLFGLDSLQVSRKRKKPGADRVTKVNSVGERGKMLLQLTDAFKVLMENKKQQISEKQQVRASGQKKKATAGLSVAQQLQGHDRDAHEVTVTLDDISESKAFGDLIRTVARCKCVAAEEFVIDYIKTNVLSDDTSKLLLFCENRFMMDRMRSAVMKALGEKGDPGPDGTGGTGTDSKWKHVWIDGRVRSASRDAAVKKFQKDPQIRVAVLGIAAACKSITLTAANHVIFSQIVLKARQHLQAEMRAARLGQKRPVNITYLIAKLPGNIETIETIVWEMFLKKCDVLSRVMDGVAMDFPVTYRGAAVAA